MAWYMIDEKCCISSQEQGGGFSEVSLKVNTSSDVSKLNSTLERYSLKDSRMEYCQCSRSGMMSLLSAWITKKRENTSNSSDQEITLPLQEDSLARISPLQEREMDLREKEAVYGLNSSASFAKFDPSTFSWKTQQLSLLGELMPYSEDWPKQGMMLDGVCYPQKMSVRHTSENEFGLKPSRGGQLEKWPTPTCHDCLGAYSPEGLIRKDGKSRMDQLQNAVLYRPFFPTPCITGMAGGTGSVDKIDRLYDAGSITLEERRSMRSGNGGTLNPDWSEWLMGWPIGWTDIDRSVTDLSSWIDKTRKGSWWDEEPVDRLSTRKSLRKQRLIAIGNGQVPRCIMVL